MSEKTLKAIYVVFFAFVLLCFLVADTLWQKSNTNKPIFHAQAMKNNGFVI